jgi:hypothetical protein
MTVNLAEVREVPGSDRELSEQQSESGWQVEWLPGIVKRNSQQQ